jgi:DNA-binding NarL/FixJ family response regulator
MAGSVLIVDDNQFMRSTLRRLFASQPDFEVCGEAEDGREAIDKAKQLYPDLIVMDLSMPHLSGIEAARILSHLMPTVPIIIFSEYGDVLSEQEASSHGISAVVSKSEQISLLLGEARTLLCRRMAA